MKIKQVIKMLLFGLALTPLAVQAQDPPPPTTSGGYTIDGNTELGVRFLGTAGNFDQYRSDLNYGKGFRVFDFNYLMRQPNDQGLLFDTLRINAHGWGGDPNAYMRLEAEKTKWYRFDMNFRRFDYFNDLSNIALGEHAADLRRRFGDYNLTLLPQNDKIKINLGYTSDSSKGPSFSTFDYQRNEYQIQSPVQNQSNDFRFGFDAKLFGFDLSFLQGIRSYKQDTTYLIPSLSNGNDNTSSINTFKRDMPTRGHIPFTRFSLHRGLTDKIDVTGRFIYSVASSDYNLIETTNGKDASGNNIVLDSFNGNGAVKRFSVMGDLGISYYATDKLILSETARVNDFRITGSDVLDEQLFRTKPSGAALAPTFTDAAGATLTRYIEYYNQAEADYKFSKRFSAHGGYRYTNRQIALSELNATGTPPATPTGTPNIDNFRNNTNAGFVGFKAQPFPIWTMYGDFERGTADNVFTRVANYDYTNARVRNTIRPTQTLSISASLQTKNNNNPTLSLSVPPTSFGVESRSRSASASVDWEPNTKFTLSSGYTYSQVHTDAAVIFFISNVIQNGSSLYYMNDNFAFFNAKVQVHPRATIQVGYRLDKDSGQGDRVAASAAQILSSYPLNFQSPEAKLTVKITKNVDWHAGWQYYDYAERFATNRNYRANTAFTSLTIRFSRE